VKCKTHKTQDKIEIMADSGASECFTHRQGDLTEFEVLDDKDLVVKTASKTNSLKIKGKGAWIITHKVTHRGKKQSITSRLYPVYYLPGLTHQLMSVGHLLNDGLELKGSSSSLEFSPRTVIQEMIFSGGSMSSAAKNLLTESLVCVASQTTAHSQMPVPGLVLQLLSQEDRGLLNK
jgi:hypothetical protein